MENDFSVQKSWKLYLTTPLGMARCTPCTIWSHYNKLCLDMVMTWLFGFTGMNVRTWYSILWRSFFKNPYCKFVIFLVASTYNRSPLRKACICWIFLHFRSVIPKWGQMLGMAIHRKGLNLSKILAVLLYNDYLCT
jgi:hypothetical protein